MFQCTYYTDKHQYRSLVFYPPISGKHPVIHPLDHKLMEFSFHLVAMLPRICILYAHIILYYTGNLGESYGVDPAECALVAFEIKSSMLFERASF